MFCWGDLIKMGAQRKREEENKQLTDKIFNLETQHKQSLTIWSAQALLESRKPLQKLLDAKA